jgi:hypothetical protein
VTYEKRERIKQHERNAESVYQEFETFPIPLQEQAGKTRKQDAHEQPSEQGEHEYPKNKKEEIFFHFLARGEKQFEMGMQDRSHGLRVREAAGWSIAPKMPANVWFHSQNAK